MKQRDAHGNFRSLDLKRLMLVPDGAERSSLALMHRNRQTDLADVKAPPPRFCLVGEHVEEECRGSPKFAERNRRFNT